MTDHAVALLGAGKMGAALVDRWVEAGRPVVVWNRNGAGAGRLTIVVPKMESARHALSEIGVSLSGEKQGDFGKIAQISDPDGNLITLAEPPGRS